MSDATDFARRIAAADPPIHGGNIRVFGDWFGGGRPFDALYSLKSVEADGDSLRFVLDDLQTLTLHAPRGLTIDRYGLRVEDASSVRLDWQEGGGSKHVDLNRESGTEQLAPYIRNTSAEERREARALEIWQEVPPVHAA